MAILGLVSLLLFAQTEASDTYNFQVVSNKYVVAVGNNSPTPVQATEIAKHPVWVDIPGAKWIYDGGSIQAYKTSYYKVQFYIPGVPTVGVLTWAADDTGYVLINGLNPGCPAASFTSASSCNIYPYLLAGTNTAQFTVPDTGAVVSGLSFKIDIVAKVN